MVREETHSSKDKGEASKPESTCKESLTEDPPQALSQEPVTVLPASLTDLKILGDEKKKEEVEGAVGSKDKVATAKYKRVDTTEEPSGTAGHNDLATFIKEKKMDSSVCTILCENIKDLLEVEKELQADPSGAFADITVYNPYQPHKSTSDVIGDFLTRLEDNKAKGRSIIQRIHSSLAQGQIERKNK